MGHIPQPSLRGMLPIFNHQGPWAYHSLVFVAKDLIVKPAKNLTNWEKSVNHGLNYHITHQMSLLQFPVNGCWCKQAHCHVSNQEKPSWTQTQSWQHTVITKLIQWLFQILLAMHTLIKSSNPWQIKFWGLQHCPEHKQEQSKFNKIIWVHNISKALI